jgi:hypothetical protein
MTQEKKLAVVTGYIMYYDLLNSRINGSYFSKIDTAIEIATAFVKEYPDDKIFQELDWEETLEQFVNNYDN